MNPAPPRHRRAHVERSRVIDALWLALRRARKPISAWELAERAGASRTQAKRLVQAARDAGWLTVTHDVQPNANAPGAIKTALYRIAADAPAMAPVLRLDGGKMAAVALDGEGRALPGAALAELRRARGWSAAEAAEAIGVKDRRTVRRYEAAAALPQDISARVGTLLREPSSPRRHQDAPQPGPAEERDHHADRQ